MSYTKEDELVDTRCNNCYWTGSELDLVMCYDDPNDKDSVHKGCPNCKTDSYLTDLPLPVSIRTDRLLARMNDNYDVDDPAEILLRILIDIRHAYDVVGADYHADESLAYTQYLKEKEGVL